MLGHIAMERASVLRLENDDLVPDDQVESNRKSRLFTKRD
jgi:hypothetical protein